jgi:hypothetical protein
MNDRISYGRADVNVRRKPGMEEVLLSDDGRTSCSTKINRLYTVIEDYIAP